MDFRLGTAETEWRRRVRALIDDHIRPRVQDYDARVQGIKKPVLDGTASHVEAAEMAKRVPTLAAAASRFAQKAGA